MKARKPSGDRKAEIITVALTLAFEVGPDHVTTSMIAARVGLSQPAIYKHFSGKSQIWLGVSEMLCTRINESAQTTPLAGATAVAGLRRLVMGHLRLISEFPALPEIMVSRDPTGMLSEARRQVQTAMTDYRATLALCFEQVRAAGCLREGLRIEDGVALIFGIIQSLVLRLIVTRDPQFIEQEGGRLLDMQLMLFNPEGNTP